MTPIPPTRIVRRIGRKRHHITDTVEREKQRGSSRPYEPTMCGQRLRPISAVVRIARTAEAIECDECLISAISQGRAR